MKLPSLLTLIAASLALTSLVSAADVTIYYPSEEKPVFSITAPEDWEFEAGSADDPYCTLTKDDTVLYFKTVEGTEEKLNEAIEETYEYVKENYPKAELPTPEKVKIDGKDAVAAAGSGKDKEGVLTHFGFAWVFVGKGKIAEIWFEAADADEKLSAEAGKILKSFKAK
ncbi:MAG: hypothetical protein RL693_2867 [Verrucomicrobiota bacterium]|jgi:hypothetical protein